MAKSPAPQPATTAAPIERVEVTIARAGHTHAGKPCQPGQKITVLKRQAARLVAAGFVDPAK